MNHFLALIVSLFFFGGLATADDHENLLEKHGIEIGTLDADYGNFSSVEKLDMETTETDIKLTCRSGFQVNHHQFFNNRNQAVQHCNGFNQRLRLGNLCVVRQYSNNRFGSGFRFNGFAQRQSFRGGLQAILAFLFDAGLLNQVFDFLLALDGPQGC